MTYQIEQTTQEMLDKLPPDQPRRYSEPWKAFLAAVDSLQPGQSFQMEASRFDSNHRNAVAIVQLLKGARLRTQLDGRWRRIYRLT